MIIGYLDPWGNDETGSPDTKPRGSGLYRP